MTTFCLDPVNGNDANNGSTWALAWKTFTAGATAARTAPGDIIKVAKTPDPVSLGVNATWNDRSKTVTLASSLTLAVDQCETAWTASANVTATAYSASRKEGSYCASLAIASGFTTGKVAYKALGSAINFSSYQKITFWYKPTTASQTCYTINLCSDTTGDTVVNSFSIPACPSASVWIPVTIDYGSALGASIQSIAIYATVDPGTATIYLDNISACNSFSLVDLISKNSAASGGNEGWFPIQSIVGTTILIDNDLACLPTAGRGYYGTTETVATYRRTAFRITNTADWVIQESGSSASVMMSYQGGYDTVGDTQNGETFMDGAGLGVVITLPSGDYVRLNRISFCRGAGAINSNTGTGHNEISCHNVCAMSAFFSTYGPLKYENYSITNFINNAAGFTLLSTTSDCDFTFTNVNNNNSYGITCPGGGNRITFTKTCNNVNSGLYLNGNGLNTIVGTDSKYNTTYGIQIASGSVLPNRIFNISTANNTTAGLYYAGLAGDYCKNLTLGEGTPVSTSMSYFYAQPLVIEQYGGTVGDNRRFYYQGNLFSQTATRHTASGVAWAAYILNSSTRAYPFSALEVPIFRRLVDSGSAITVTCWVRKGESSYGVRLICRGRQLAGVDSDVMDDISVGIDTWEQLSVTFTPSAVGVIEVSALVWSGSSSYAVFIDDVGVS